MISRTLLKQSSRLGSLTRSIPSTSLTRSQCLPRNTSFTRAILSRPIGATRWYSSEPAAAKEEVKKEGDSASAEGKEGGEEDAVKKELEKKDKEIIDLKDRYLRSVAEFRNLQERTKRDMQSARDFAIQKFAKDLIESVDNFDRALSIVPTEKLQSKPSNADSGEDDGVKDLIALYDGLKMTEGILMSTLKKHGLERFDPAVEGERFNPNEHEATFMTPMEGKEENTIFHTQQKGFKLNGRVLRAAKVGVVKNS